MNNNTLNKIIKFYFELTFDVCMYACIIYDQVHKLLELTFTTSLRILYIEKHRFLPSYLESYYKAVCISYD